VSPKARSDRGKFRVWRTHSTRWADNDAYGHVNNVVYYEWFDSAVNAWLVGQGLLDIEHGDPIALVVETRCNYWEPLAFPADVEVGLAIEHLGRSSMRYRIGIFAAGAEEAAAEGHFIHVMVDRASRRPVPIPDEWRRALGGIAAD
jgi:acyl-CoA thioester hydrolase